jgi:predicted ATP-grasp superfamily ATP-dependent carboligase
MKQKIIVLGKDHTNSTGIAQTMGREGFPIIAVLWGANKGLVASSKYVQRVYTASSPQGCIDLIREKLSSEQSVIIACCDDAAIALERNRNVLGNNMRFGYTDGKWSIEELCDKKLQVKLAAEVGFDVPWTSSPIESIDDVPEFVPFPCITKPLISSQGFKKDLRVVRSKEELIPILKNLLEHTKRIILQQYIERDFEISVLGCGLKGGEVVIPCVENKLTLYPKYVGLECLANIQPLKNMSIITPIKNLINKVGYIGLFSVEMMHSKMDDHYYFTEINLRNDGANSLVYKYGVNLPLNHFEDLCGIPLTQFNVFHPGYYIWEMHHTLSLIRHEISFFKWLKEIMKSEGLLLYFKDDRRPFFKQYLNWVMSILHIHRKNTYK